MAGEVQNAAALVGTMFLLIMVRAMRRHFAD